jgi:hypothetical protein
MNQSLFEQDYILWVQENLSKLKVKDFENLDLDNVIEEFESLIYIIKKELDDKLTSLLIHLLKRLYVNIPSQFERWQSDISFYRCGIELIFEDAPSLKENWDERFDFNYSSALYALSADYPDTNFPEAWQLERDIESILNKRFWQ